MFSFFYNFDDVIMTTSNYFCYNYLKKKLIIYSEVAFENSFKISSLDFETEIVEIIFLF